MRPVGGHSLVYGWFSLCHLVRRPGSRVESFQPVGGCSLMRLVGGRRLGGLQFYVVSLLLAVHYLFLAGGGSL